MSELRWTLLILGVVFIAALSWWERRRPRQAFAPRLREASFSHDAQRTLSPEPAAGTEPWIGEDGIADVVSSDMAFTNTDAARDHAHEAHGPLEELPTVMIGDGDERLALAAAWDDQPPEPRLIDPEAPDAGELPVPFAADEPDDAADPSCALEPISAKELDGATGLDSAAQPRSTVAPDGETEPPPRVASAQALVAGAAESPAAPTPSVAPAAPSVAPAVPAEPEIAGAEGVGAVRVVESPYGDGAPPVEVIVEWPPESSRRILALRLVAPQPARFAGRALRLALAAEGFLLGKFSIFHKPDETNHALLSAASLNRPGSFDLETMDSQRYGGLSLFIVLPGRRTPQQAFEELLIAARNLNERLEGALQDERGGPLTPLRVASMRESLRSEGTLPAAAAHGT